MTAASASRSFLTRPFSKRCEADDIDNQYPKGPLGLSTLHEPAGSVVADLVFVHGLGGGSRSTWSKSSDVPVFWPQDWLPTDADFQESRIHTFGYNSNWQKESVLNIHDFARALLGALLDCPTIPRASPVCIALLTPYPYTSCLFLRILLSASDLLTTFTNACNR